MQHFTITVSELNGERTNLFTTFQTSEKRARKRQTQVQSDIDSGAYKTWPSESKRTAVDEAVNSGARVTTHYGVAL